MSHRAYTPEQEKRVLSMLGCRLRVSHIVEVVGIQRSYVYRIATRNGISISELKIAKKPPKETIRIHTHTLDRVRVYSKHHSLTVADALESLSTLALDLNALNLDSLDKITRLLDDRIPDSMALDLNMNRVSDEDVRVMQEFQERVTGADLTRSSDSQSLDLFESPDPNTRALDLGDSPDSSETHSINPLDGEIIPPTLDSKPSGDELVDYRNRVTQTSKAYESCLVAGHEWVRAENHETCHYCGFMRKIKNGQE